MSATRRMMKGRGRRVAAVAGAGVALVALAGCNPTETTLASANGLAKFQYDGPVDAWFEANVTDTGGYRVQFQGAVHVPDFLTNHEQRRCRNNVDRNVEQNCGTYEEFPPTERHDPSGDAAGTYWPMVLLHPGDQFLVAVYCPQLKNEVCPSSTTVHVRTVDASGALVGDIQPITAFGRA